MNMDENEKKYTTYILTYLDKLMNNLFSYLNFLSPDSEKIKYPYYLARYKSLGQTESNNDIINKNNNNKYMKLFTNTINALNEQLDEFGKYYNKNSNSFQNYKCIKELNNLYKIQNSLRMRNICIKERTQKNELIYLMFNHIANICEYSLIEETLKSEIKTYYILRKQNNYKQDKNNNNNNNQIDHIEVTNKINNYIIETLTCNIEFNYDSKGIINIKYFPFNIIIGFPTRNNLPHLKNKVSIHIHFIHHKYSYQDLILLDKIKTLFENRIISILNIIFEERKINSSFNSQNCIEFVTIFLNYIYNYNNIMRMKCSFCNQITRYSYKEKNFFPPYYKLLKISKGAFEPKNNNEKNNLFFHEECFKRISNPSL